MKDILRKGVIERLFPDRGGGGLTKETHLVVYDDRKYVLRKCKDIARAKYYESLSRKFEDFGFLPKFLGRINRNVFYEYVEGRDLKFKGEKLDYLKQVGAILARINSFEFKSKLVDYTSVFLDELVSGKYKSVAKVEVSRKKRGVEKVRTKVLSKTERKNILKVLEKLKSDMKLKIVYECTDPMPGNFRVRKGRVYLVDIESIRPKYRGFGISKILLKWATSKTKRDRFVEGYGKDNMRFFDSRYRAFSDLNFLIQRVWFGVQTGKDYGDSLERIFEIIREILTTD